MKKVMYIMVVLALCLNTKMLAQSWTYEGAWPDTNYKGGTHGIAVSPDGKVWQASYYSNNWILGEGDTMKVTPILVFNADGTFVDTIYTVTSGSTTDTLNGSCRGMRTDADGNILYVQSAPSKIIKINYQTMEGMGSHLLTEVGSSPTAPAADSNGTIFVGPVVGGGTSAIAMYNSDLSYLGNAVVAPPNIARTMEVSLDGNTVYWTPFTSSAEDTLQMYIYTRPSEFEDFALTDTVLQGMSIESAAWNPATGLLWLSNDSRGIGPYTHLTWYGFDVSTKTFVDSFTLPSPIPGASDELPRGIDFSPDGNIAYVGLFGVDFDRIFKFSRVTGIVKEHNSIVNGYSLSQNYPNPFNPSTKITFSVLKEGLVTLKIYDVLGREVAQLVNERLANGTYTADFNGSNLTSGVYIYEIKVNNFRTSKKMTLIK